MARVGRPVTKKGKAAAKHRESSREEYRSLPVSKRKERVANRDSEAQRQADAKRLKKHHDSRTAYHRADAKAVKDVPKGSKCARCGATTNIQRHVVKGKFKEYLCGRCNTRAIGRS